MADADEDIVDYYERFATYRFLEYMVCLGILPQLLFFISYGWIHASPVVAFLVAPPGESVKTGLFNLFLVIFLSDFVAIPHAMYIVGGWRNRIRSDLWMSRLTRWMHDNDQEQ